VGEESAGKGGAVAEVVVSVGWGEGSEEGGEEFGSGVGGRCGGEGPKGLLLRGVGGQWGGLVGGGLASGHMREEFFSGEVGVNPIVLAIVDGVDLAFQPVLSGDVAVRGRGGNRVEMSLNGKQLSQTWFRRKHVFLHYQFVENFVINGTEIGSIVEILEVRVVAEMGLGVKIH